MRQISLTPLRGKNPDKGAVFDSMTEFADYVAALPSRQRSNENDASSWTGNEDFASALRKTRNGDLSNVARADKLLDKIEAIMPHFETRKAVTVDAMSGGVPNVPAFLAGQPLNMRRRQRIMSDAAPLNIVVDLGVAAEISANTIQNKGAAVLALVRILSASRPVNLYLAYANSPCTAKNASTAFCAVRVESAPLNLARAAFALTNAGFPRCAIFSALLGLVEGNNSDYFPFPYNDGEFYKRNLHAYWSRVLGVDGAETLVVPPLRDSSASMAFSDPVKWVADMVAAHGVPLAE